MDCFSLLIGTDYKSTKYVYFSMGDLVSMGTKPTSSAVLQTMLYVPPPLWQDWSVAEHSYPGKCAQPSIQFLLRFPSPSKNRARGGFRDVQLSSHFPVASLVMLFETGTSYMMMINIRHVSQCFFKLSVKLSGNINKCLFFIVLMPLLQILHRSTIFLTQMDQISIICWQFALFDGYLLLIQVCILHLAELAMCQTLF